MNKMLTVVLSVLVAGSAMAGPSKNYYADEVYAASRVAFQFSQTFNVEPVVCYPYPQYFEDFYWTIQQTVNAYVESYPKRERGNLSVTIGFKVWDAIQENWGC